MSGTAICPLCKKPVDTNSEAHVTEKNGEVRHHECPVDPPPETQPE